MTMAIILFILGTALVVIGGDHFVDAAGWVSDATGISKVVIGATLVTFATTAPEFFVSLIAALKGSGGLSAGNAVGSLACNLGLAFALLALFAPGVVQDRLFGVKGLMMVSSAAALLLFCLDGTVSVPEGIVLVLLFALATFVNIRNAREGEGAHERKKADARGAAVNVSKFVLGGAAIIFGSNLIVDSAHVIAAGLGISEKVIGLTVVAVGTSLPEIVTSIAAIVKKQSALSLGNIIGANILDGTLIMAAGAFVTGGKLAVPESTAGIDLPVTLLIMLIAVLPAIFSRKIHRWQGLLIVVIYGLFLGSLAFTQGG